MSLRRAVPAILLVLLLAGQAGAQNLASSGWPALGQDDQRQGQAGWGGTPDQKASYPPGSPVLWSYPMGGLSGPTAGEAVGPHGTTYVASQNGTLYAVGVQGQEKWSFNLGAPAHTAPVLGDNGWVYAGAGDTFYAVAAAGGTQVWSFCLDNGKVDEPCKGKGWSVVGSPALAGGTVYFTANGGKKGYVFALNAATGAEDWQYRLKDTTQSAPALSPGGGTLYVGDQGGYLYALDALDGSLSWHKQPCLKALKAIGVCLATALATPAVGPRGNVYVGGEFELLRLVPFGGVVSVDPSGGQRWSYPRLLSLLSTLGASFPAAPALTSSGSLYIGESTLTGGGALLSLSRSDGDPNWSHAYATSNPVESAPAVGEHGAAYFGDTGGAFYAVSPSGSLLWQYQLDSAVRDAPAVGPDGTVYVATSAASGSLYALQQVHFTFALPQPFPACSQVSITVYADNPAGGAVLGYAGPASLTGSPQSVTPSVTGGFTGGAWTGPVQIATATTGETLTATDPGNPAYTGQSAPFTVVAGPLASVSISPTSASLAEGQSQAFAAQAYDGCGNAITAGVSYAWSATGGTVSPATGSSTTYTAPDVPGTYTVTVTAIQGTRTAQAQATVTVSSSPLAVSPPSAVLAVPLSQGAAAAPAAQQFTATYVGKGGQVGNVGPTAQWTASAGTLSCTTCAAPVFTPPGPGSYTVTCTYRGLTGQATVQAVQAVRMVDASAAAGPSSLVAQLEQDGTLVRVLTWLLH